MLSYEALKRLFYRKPKLQRILNTKSTQQFQKLSQKKNIGTFTAIPVQNTEINLDFDRVKVEEWMEKANFDGIVLT